MSVLVSIVLPVRDDAERLVRSIQSIRAQSFAGWDLVVVDDGSTDASLATAQAIATHEPRMRVISTARAGVAAARNLGMDASNARWIAVADSDDFWHPSKLERQIEFVDEHPQIGVLGTLGYRVSATGKHLGVFDLGPTSPEQYRRFRRTNTPFGLIHPSVIFRRDLLERTGGYPSDYPLGEDLSFFNLYVAPHTQVAVLGERLVSVEIRPDSIQKRRVDAAFDVHEAVALNLRRQHVGLPLLGYAEATASLAGGSAWRRLIRRRMRERHRHYTLGASALAAGSPQGLAQIGLALAIAPFYTARRLASQLGWLAVERLRGLRAVAH